MAERATGGDGERAEDEQDDQERRNRQKHQQGRQSSRRPRSRVDRALDVNAEQAQHGRHERMVAQLRGVKEERPVVGGRRDVERILRVERVAIRRVHQARVVVAAVAERRGRRARHIENREAEGGGRVEQGLPLLRRERRLLQQEGGDLVVLDDREAVGRIPSAPRAGFLRQRDQPQPVEDPPRDAEHAAIGQVIEVVVERFDRVERVFTERVGAGRGRRPGVDERRLDDVVPGG